MKKFVLNDLYLTDKGNYVSHGYYAGRNEKYGDLINITFGGALLAKRYDTAAEAEEIAKIYNNRGYNFVVEEIEDIPILPKTEEETKKWLKWRMENYWGARLSFEINNHRISTIDCNTNEIIIDGKIVNLKFIDNAIRLIFD